MSTSLGSHCPGCSSAYDRAESEQPLTCLSIETFIAFAFLQAGSYFLFPPFFPVLVERSLLPLRLGHLLCYIKSSPILLGKLSRSSLTRFQLRRLSVLLLASAFLDEFLDIYRYIYFVFGVNLSFHQASTYCQPFFLVLVLLVSAFTPSFLLLSLSLLYVGGQKTVGALPHCVRKSSRLHSSQQSSVYLAEMSSHTDHPDAFQQSGNPQSDKPTATRPAMPSGTVRARRLVSCYLLP